MRRKIYRYIIDFKQQHDGISPTTYEIAEALKVSRSTVRYHLIKLIELGMISLYGDGVRNIMIVGGYALPSRDPERYREIEDEIEKSG